MLFTRGQQRCSLWLPVYGSNLLALRAEYAKQVYETERCTSFRLSVPFPLRTLLVCGLMDNIKMWTGLPWKNRSE